MVIVTHENGIDIHCDDAGKFSAYAYGQRYEDRSLAKVKKWVASVKPTVTLMEVNPEDRYRSTRTFHLHDNIAAVAIDAKGETFGQAPTDSSGRSGYRFGYTYRNLYEPDKEVQEQITALNAERAEWDREVQARYDAAFAEIVATLTPITPERFAEMLAARTAAKEQEGGDDSGLR